MREEYILGEGISVQMDAETTGLNNNVMVVGASGAGKTMSYAEMCLLHTKNSSLLVTLSKRRLVRKYMAYMRENGFRVWDLNLVEPEKSTVAYDPMAYVKTQADITYLAQSIVMANPRKPESKESDPFWDDAAISLLSALIAYVMHVKSRPGFDDVLHLFAKLAVREKSESIETTLDEPFDRLRREDPEHFAVQCWKTFRYAPMRTASCIYSALSVTMDTIFSPAIRRMMRDLPPADLKALAGERSVLFVTTSPVNASLNAFAGLFYSHAVKELFEYAESLPEGRLPVPVHLLCDDFAVGAQIPEFARYISIFREKKISVSILLQSESQLRAMYGPEDAETIINNCDRYIYMGGMDLTTCRNIAERAGENLREILYMPIGQEIVFQRGSWPVKTARNPITRDPAWGKAAELAENYEKQEEAVC